MNRTLQAIIIGLCVLCIVGGLLVALTSESVTWKLEELRAQVKYALNPPQAVAFEPHPPATTAPAATFPVLTPTATIDLSTPTQPPPSPTVTPTPTMIPTPLPPQAALSGFLHQYQMMNNCGPANLAMALSFWGWKGDQRMTAAMLKPNKLDKNVMPYEMEAYVEQETDLEAVVRVGGDLTMLKAFLSSGFPVIVERGYEGATFDGWMGHYQVVTGYDDAAGEITVQDSYKGPDLRLTYAELENTWRAFNYTYLVIYPPERRQQVLDILGLQAYDNFNNRTAEQRATEEIPLLSGRDLYFALFNQGANRVALQDYSGAAASFDAAFANYALLPQNERPWRMLWYQTGPYFAYYYTGRYLDVVTLATQTLDAMSDPILEESFYWRAKALIAMGETETAITDLQTCTKVHPGFEPCVEELARLGVSTE